MSAKPIILLALIVLLPLILLTWLGIRLAHDEQAMYEQRIKELLTGQLTLINDEIGDYFAKLDRDLERITSAEDLRDIEAMRAAGRSEPQIEQLFLLRPDGELLFPDIVTGSEREREFLTRSRRMFVDKDISRLADSVAGVSNTPPAPQQTTDADRKKNPDSQLDANSAAQQTASPQQNSPRLPAANNQNVWLQMARSSAGNSNGPTINPSAAAKPVQGWYLWYLDRGLNLMYWHRHANGFIVGAELNQSRWMADLFAALPDTSLHIRKRATPTDDEMRVRLVNTSGQSMYQWGRFPTTENQAPACEIAVAEPLAPWRLQYFTPPNKLTAGRDVYMNLAIGLGVAAFSLACLTWFFYRDYARDIKEASQRVSFVNQVSHELKTPLTNIRMYADLLERDLQEFPAESTSKPNARLEVIVSEAGRLSRLIGNVLTFARQERKTLQLRPQEKSIDAVIRTTLDHFAPALEQQKIETTFSPGADRPKMIDTDVVEQILGNLINNVEKYAANGGVLQIASTQSNGMSTITVSDNGPGIDANIRGRIFQPFTRASNDIEKVAGTGIGLSIARDLARLHGGDLRLLPTEVGATFQIDLATPAVNSQIEQPVPETP